MKSILTIIIFFLIVFTTISQEFKEVKTAQDVVDNFILASGGTKLLSSVESISMKGKMGDGEQAGTIDIYFSKKYVYLNLVTQQFSMKQAVDIEKKKGWTKFGTMIKDLNEEDIARSKKNIEGALWSNYLDPKTNGITFELLQNEIVDSNDTYVVDLMREGASVSTSYFDAKTFYKVKEVKGSMTNEFSDFKQVGSTGIIMPYKNKALTGEVTINEIKFNSKFDKKLLKKPKEEKDDLKQDDK